METKSEIILVFAFTFLAFILMALVLILFFYYSRKKIVAQQLETKNLEIAHQKQMLQTVIQTQEAERERIARDLHDGISSKLNVVSLNSHLLKTPNLSDAEIINITNNITDLTSKALENSRQIAHDLFPPVFDKFGLKAGIEELIVEFKSTNKFEVSFSNELNLDLLTKEQQLNFFRIIQELLNNTLKYAQAKEVSIKFIRLSKFNALIYKDDGIGFKNLAVKKGMGLTNIESRVSFLKANYLIKSSPDNGFEINITF